MAHIIISSMEEIDQKSIVVTDGMRTLFPQFNRIETIYLHNYIIEPNKMKYAYNNGIVAYIDQWGFLHVIPDLKGVQKKLVENGYHKGHFYVPFSNWDFPVAHKEKWDALLKEKKSSN